MKATELKTQLVYLCTGVVLVPLLPCDKVGDHIHNKSNKVKGTQRNNGTCAHYFRLESCSSLIKTYCSTIINYKRIIFKNKGVYVTECSAYSGTVYVTVQY